MEKYIVRCQTYDAQKLESFINNEDVRGIILGDILCEKRMFKGGAAQQIVFTDKTLKSGKTLYYQVPLYVTCRNLDYVKSVLDLIESYRQISYAIVQDFGTARLIYGEYKNIKLIWGAMGRVRERRYSNDFLNFLKSHGFVGMETCDLSLAKRLCGTGLTPYFPDCELQYKTVGRNCYLKYQTGECDPEVCRGGRYSLKAEDGSIEMTVNGYLLGESHKRVSGEEITEACKKYAAVKIVAADNL